MGRYKNFRDGLFRPGDVVNITFKRAARGVDHQTMMDLTIEEVRKDHITCTQYIVDPLNPGGRKKPQCLWFSNQEVVDITPIKSLAWEEEYRTEPAEDTLLDLPQSQPSDPAEDRVLHEGELDQLYRENLLRALDEYYEPEVP